MQQTSSRVDKAGMSFILYKSSKISPQEEHLLSLKCIPILFHGFVLPWDGQRSIESFRDISTDWLKLPTSVDGITLYIKAVISFKPFERYYGCASPTLDCLSQVVDTVILIQLRERSLNTS
jgi:hypothetical protein